MSGRAGGESSVDTSRAIVTLSRAQPLATIDTKNILHVSWPRVANEMRDTITRVREEGHLDSEHLADTITLIAFAVRKLNEEDAEARESLGRKPKLNFLQQLLGLLPTEVGARVREMIIKRFKAEKQAEAMEATSQEIHALRLELATIIDEKLHARLLNTDETYASMHQKSEHLRLAMSQGSAFLDLMATSSEASARYSSNPIFSTHQASIKHREALTHFAGAIVDFLHEHHIAIIDSVSVS